MSELRQNKLASLIQAQAGRFFLERQLDWKIGKTILVDGVLVSPDLKHAQIWVSFSQSDEAQSEKLFVALEKHLHELVTYLFEELTLRRMPRLTLKLSNTEKAFKLMDLFDTIRGGQTGTTDQGNPDGGEADNPGDAH